jgi:hypothetical protein
MNYSSYLGSKKCDKVICTRGPPGPPGPPGQILNSFTIISSIGVNNEFDNTITWDIDIPFIYGHQFTFNFYTYNINVIPIDIVTSLPSDILTTVSSRSYIFGEGEAVYQTYTINSNNNIYYAYIPFITSSLGVTSDTSFIIKITVNSDNTVTYKFVYTYDPNESPPNYINFVNSKIKLNGIKYN